ncbi:MAG TPA: cob(I)yrinic acid a,c-diamide adenosyltransferase [Bacteroidales bacterium]|jgi:cob(I)alamin adenosyltransferase
MSTDWKIYTKTGDKGETSLLGGTRVPKYHDRIEAYGTLDELNSYIGLLRDQDIDIHYKEILLIIQDRLFTAESLLAADPLIEPTYALPQMHEEDILLLENEIDKMNEVLPQLTSFILPGGHPAVSHAHIARCICRRAERLTIKLSTSSPLDMIIIRYLNRLSDFLFVLARMLAKDLNATETVWKAII